MYSFKDSVPFGRRLAEAVAWCSRCIAGDPAHSLRTRELAPSPLEATRADVVLSVLRHRELRLPRKPRAIVSDRQLEGGRLLCYYPDANLADGAAASVSEEFFDDDNIPPWDTWVGLYGSGEPRGNGIYLVSYVPGGLIERATAGMEVNPEQCIVWLGDSDTPLASTLRDQGWKL
jgi:hypothetical protein